MVDEADFDTEVEIKTRVRKFKYQEILAKVLNRDMSQLNLISDDEYFQGLDRIRHDEKAADSLIGDISFINLTGIKI